MYECIPCVCGAPDCMLLIKIIKNDKSEILENTTANYSIIYPVYYEEYIMYSGKWHFITKYFRYIGRFFKYIYKILRNDIRLVYDIILDEENLYKLQEIDPSIAAKKFDNNSDLYIISNTIKVNIFDIPFFVILNFLFKGYIAGDFYKYIDDHSEYKPEYSYIVFRIF